MPSGRYPCGVQWHLGGPNSPREGEIQSVKPRSQNMQLQIAAATWRIERKRLRLLPNYFGVCCAVAVVETLRAVGGDRVLVGCVLQWQDGELLEDEWLWDWYGQCWRLTDRLTDWPTDRWYLFHRRLTADPRITSLVVSHTGAACLPAWCCVSSHHRQTDCDRLYLQADFFLENREMSENLTTRWESSGKILSGKFNLRSRQHQRLLAQCYHSICVGASFGMLRRIILLSLLYFIIILLTNSVHNGWLQHC